MLDHRKSKIIPEKESIYAPLITLMSFIVDYNKLWKILKEMGLPDHFTCLLRNLWIKKQQLELDMEQWTGSKLGKEYKAVYCHPAYLISM